MAPGINALKTFDPPLDALAGRTVAGVRRRGKHLVVDVSGDLSLLIHLMSAGRLQLYDKHASMKDRTSRLLVRIEGDRELRLREFGTKQRAWVKLLATEAVEPDEAIATLGPEAWPDPPGMQRAAGRPGRAARCTRCCAISTSSPASGARGSTRSCGRRSCRRSSAATTSTPTRRRRCARRSSTRLGGAIDHYEAGPAAAAPGQAAAAAGGAPPPGRAVPALRHDDRGGPLRGLRALLLPAGPDRRARAEGPPALAPVEVIRRARRM